MTDKTMSKKGNIDPKAKDRAKKKSKNNRLLITVTVLGSAGPIRFMVNESDPICGVINTTLKSYARIGRLPVLGSDATHFLLYSATDFEAICPTEAIGSAGGRNFVLWKKQMNPPPAVTQGSADTMSQKVAGKAGRLKAWLNKSFSFKVLSHQSP